MTDRRQLGLASATALVVASMIGTGVFTTSGFLLGDLKSQWLVLASWVGGGILAGLGALSYGALARKIPESGGEYVFLSRTLHPAAGYVAGWISLLVGFSAPAAAAAFGFGEYTASWMPEWWSPKWNGSAVLLVFAVIHSIHVQRGAWVQNLAVALKLVLIGGFVLLALQGLRDRPPLEPGTTDPATFAVSLVWVSFSYAGWNAAIYIGGEVRDPERNLPNSLLIGTAMVTVLYVALNAVFVFSAPPEALAGQLQIGRIAADALGGQGLADAVTVVIALALITSVSSLMMSGPRVYSKMASDGYLPQLLLSGDGPPRTAIALQLIIALILLWSAAYDSLLTFIGFTLNLSTAVTVIGLMVLKRREGRGLVVPGWPWVPGLFVAGVIAITAFTIVRRPVESLVGLATLFVGLVAWWLTERRNASRRAP